MKRRLSIWSFALLTTPVLLLVACGRLVGQSQTAPSPSTALKAPAINWDNPIDGVLEPSASAAQASVSFTAHEPQNLGSPKSRLVSLNVELPYRMLAYLYDTSYGRLVVEEIKLDRSVTQFNADQAASNADINANSVAGQGHTDAVTIRNGLGAFLSTDATGNAYVLVWADPSGVEFLIRNPGMPRDAMLNIANDL